MPAAQKVSDGRWVGRYKTPDGRHHRTRPYLTTRDALTAARAEQAGEAYTFSEKDAEGLYYVGRYPTPEGWKETADGFDSAADALAEAAELAAAARAGARPGM